MKKFFLSNKNSVYIAIALIALLLNILALIFYEFKGYLWHFHSDSAVKVLYAREIYDTKTFFPSDWYYANQDLLIIFGHLFVLPLLTFVKASFFAHAISGLISAALILYSIWLLSSMFSLSIQKRIIILAILAGGLSVVMAENLYGQVSYGVTIYITCFILYVALRLLQSQNRKEGYVWVFYLSLLITLVTFSNPVRASVYYIVPLLGSVLYLKMIHPTLLLEGIKKNLKLIVLVSLSSFLLGFILHDWVLAGAHNVQGAANIRWLSYQEMVRNFSFLPVWFLELVSGSPPQGQHFLGGVGIYFALRFVAGLMLFALIPVALLRNLQGKNIPEIILSIFTVTLFAIVGCLQTITTVVDIKDMVQSARYLVPPIFLFLLVFLFRPLQVNRLSISSFLTCFVYASIFFGVTPNFFIKNVNNSLIFSVPGNFQNSHTGLSKYLEGAGLHYGYATYWHAGVVTVLSSEEVLVRPITINDKGLPMPFRFLTSNRWYSSGAWSGETFLALTTEENSSFKPEEMISYGVKLTKKLLFENYVIYVFDKNPSKFLPGWNVDYRDPYIFQASQNSFKQIGKFYSSYKEFSSVLVAEKGEIGALHFGPYVRLESGKYQVTFDVISGKNINGVVRLDVYSSSDPKLYIEKNFNEILGVQEFEFTLKKPESIEFRVWTTGNERVIFKSASLKKLN